MDFFIFDVLKNSKKWPNYIKMTFCNMIAHCVHSFQQKKINIFNVKMNIVRKFTKYDFIIHFYSRLLAF
jgi:hypothetical protein